MTQEEKTYRLLDAQEAPEAYSEEELRTMLADPELRETAALLAQLKRAYVQEETEEADVDAEWERFVERSAARPLVFPIAKIRKLAAAFAALLMLSGIAYAAVYMASGRAEVAGDGPSPTSAAPTYSARPTVEQPADPPTAAPKTFENVPLKDIVQELGAHYGVAVRVSNPEAASLRLYYPWNPQMPLGQVVDELNRFEKVKLTLTSHQVTIE